MNDVHTTITRAPRTLLHGVGAAAITLLTFGLGPAVGLGAAATELEPQLVEMTMEGAPAGTIDMDSLALLLADEGADDDELDAVAAAADDGPADEVGPEVPEPQVAEVDETAAPTRRPVEKAGTNTNSDEEGEDEVLVAELDEKGKDSKRAKRRKGRRCDPDPNPRIQRDAKGEFTVEKKLVTWYISHIRELNSLGWSRKEKGDDGKSVGMKIGGVKCGNDLFLAGIRSGDVVHRVNGHDVHSIPQAVFVYGKVRKDRVIRVDLTRRGKPVTLTYRFS